MSFGLSAAAVGLLAVGATAAVGVGTALYSADQQRKVQHTQQDAITKAQQDDAAEAAAAQTNAVTASNAKLAAAKRAQQANVLGTGADTLGASPASSVLGGGAPTVSAGRAVPVQPKQPSAVF